VQLCYKSKVGSTSYHKNETLTSNLFYAFHSDIHCYYNQESVSNGYLFVISPIATIYDCGKPRYLSAKWYVTTHSVVYPEL
jgi:hypothetical protein